jgi:hypothetical protein
MVKNDLKAETFNPHALSSWIGALLLEICRVMLRIDRGPPRFLESSFAI